MEIYMNTRYNVTSPRTGGTWRGRSAAAALLAIKKQQNKHIK